ncbi:hypothetical protein [Flavobacterium sp.]|uniref:hypothetical protein n=1 Tax=Flavobacterium sp. TaxID=239 RepID=UPI002626DF3A|nr:hypothetical protein [Flavobacterium sp.]
MILIVFKYLTPRGFRGLTFYPFVFLADKDDKLNKVFINHERIHIRQQIELLILPFYLWYFTEYLLRLVQYKNRKKAYYNISFEREAYANEKDLNYVEQRSFWMFLKYIKN